MDQREETGERIERPTKRDEMNEKDFRSSGLRDDKILIVDNISRRGKTGHEEIQMIDAFS